MTKDEALKLALEALEYIHEGANSQGPHTGISWRCVAVKAEPAITAIKQALALDKKAENARELGLDYEPADGTQVSKVWWDGEKLMAKPIPLVDFYQPVQDSTCSETLRAQGKAYPRTCRKCGLGPCIGAPKQPPAAQQDIQRLSALVRAQQITIDKLEAQRQWVGLTDEERVDLWKATETDNRMVLIDAIEAKLKEKNTP
jgi:hypothetical protein